MVLTSSPLLEVFGPQSYSPLWLVTGLLALLLVLGWPVLVVWFTRPRPPKPTPPPPPPDPDQFRAECLARIADIRRRHASGTLADRAAHQELSQTVRAFVADATNLPVDRMTLAEVKQELSNDPRFVNLAGWVEVLYPPQFAPDAQRSVDTSATEAERVVSSWH